MNKQGKKCAGKESFQRMNYLCQISNYTQPTELLSDDPSTVASNLYTNLLVNVSKKTVQRMDIDLKRTICKGCRCLLLPGVSCRVRMKKKRLSWNCMKCGTRKLYGMNDREYVSWTQQEESVVEVIDFTPVPKKLE